MKLRNGKNYYPDISKVVSYKPTKTFWPKQNEVTDSHLKYKFLFLFSIWLLARYFLLFVIPTEIGGGH